MNTTSFERTFATGKNMTNINDYWKRKVKSNEQISFRHGGPIKQAGTGNVAGGLLLGGECARIRV